MTTKLATILADFTTNLATAITIGGTTATLQSATDDDGVALPAGVYFFTIDGENSSKEHFVCTLSGTSLTAISSISRQGVQTSGAVRSHRIGATVSLTDFAHILYINDLVKGTTLFNSLVKLGYDGDPGIAVGDLNYFATVRYVNGVAVAGAPNATTAVKGIVELATLAELLAKTATGGTGASLSVTPDIMPSTLLSDYKVDTGTANTYAIAPAPAITAYTTGQIFSFKAVNANTTTSTLNVNGLGVKTIKNISGGNLVANDILAGQLCLVEYDGTNFVMLNPLANTVSLTAGAYPAGDGSALTNLTPAQIANSFTAGGSITAAQPVFIGPYQGDGGIKIDTSGSTTSNSFSITVGANSNKVLIVFISLPNSGSTVTACSYGGVAMAQVDHSTATNTSSYSFILTAPTSGANTLAITVGGSGGTSVVSWYSIYNAAQVGTAGTSAPEAHSVDTSTITTVASGAMVFYGAMAQALNTAITGAGGYENQIAVASTLRSADSGQVFPGSVVVAGTAGVSSFSPNILAMSVAPITAVIDDVVQPTSSAAATNQYFNKYSAFIGFAKTSVTTGQSVLVQLAGVVTGLSGLSKLGAQYYLNDSVGTIGTSVGTNTRKCGIALSTTTLLITNIW